MPPKGESLIFKRLSRSEMRKSFSGGKKETSSTMRKPMSTHASSNAAEGDAFAFIDRPFRPRALKYVHPFSCTAVVPVVAVVQTNDAAYHRRAKSRRQCMTSDLPVPPDPVMSIIRAVPCSE